MVMIEKYDAYLEARQEMSKEENRNIDGSNVALINGCVHFMSKDYYEHAWKPWCLNKEIIIYKKDIMDTEDSFYSWHIHLVPHVVC